jgi:cation diffusion facilitator family transporter
MMNRQGQNYRIQQWVVGIALLLFIIKVVAYYVTQSIAILTDALESTVNVVAGFIGLYSLYVAAKPSDNDHPYGHGKAEFISAAVEGTLILVAGLVIIYEAIDNFIHPHKVRQLGQGISLLAITAIINFLVGYFAVKTGKKNNSLALLASGKHLQSDTYSTVGIIAGLFLIRWTGYGWLDSVVAIVFAFLIIFTGYKIIRRSIAGIMDEADLTLLGKMTDLLNNNRQPNWIDLHNLRVIKYGGQLHVDCHLTVPWYLNVHEAHSEIDSLTTLIKKEMGSAVEFFVHSDPCLDFSCSICIKQGCHARKKVFEQKIIWTVENILSDKKHRLSK